MEEPFPDRFKPQTPFEQEVWVWFSFLDELKPPVEAYVATLAADELERSAQFQFKKDRDRYVLRRGLLREILSRYSGIDAGCLRFGCGEHGKPFLMEGQETLGLKFNISHAEEAMVCAVTRNSEVGVDLACIQEVKEARRIVEQYFSEEEAIALNKLPSTERNAAFLRCWIRKEAYVKARGEGLSLNLRGFEVFDSVDLQPRLRVPGNPAESARWNLFDLDLPGRFVGALVVEGPGHRISCGHWPGDTADFSVS